MSFFLLLMLMTVSFSAQACPESTLASATYPLSCSSLSINSDINLSNISSPIIINVTGDVSINAQVIINGQAGNLIVGDIIDLPGGAPGPGGYAGGGYSALQPESGKGSSGGSVGERDLVNCGDGGAGGGLVTSGLNGTPCLGSTLSPSNGGLPFDLSNIEIALSGGHGGGAGGEVDNSAIASGGGGGGAIYIIAGGKITLSSKASILANGGNGANSINENGAGGGGSGGVIILEASDLDIQGKLSALGGKGGRASDGGHGGNGSNGLIRLKDLEGVTDYIGEKIPPVIQELKLDSSISCGTVAIAKENNGPSSFFFQIFGPLFLLVFLNHLRRKDQSPVSE
ncbi:MAG TPA: hypothetical protein VKZ84_00700 [Bacteriovoracaceae bacterium]|nr:hypothetical protein [Bacteriovoracaceae bacterium]